MSTFGVSMMKDEADICFYTVKHMLTQVDHVIVLDNGSSDDTAELCRAAGAEVIYDPDPAYYQAQKMTGLALKAHERGAAWIVPFDADEIWYSPFNERIADLFKDIAPQWLSLSADLYNHVTTDQDSDNLNPIQRIGWRWREKGQLPKVACRWRADMFIHQGNHSVSYRGGTTTLPGQLVIRHYPYRSPEQFIRKARNGAAAYAATTLDESVGQHWRGYGRILAEHGEQALIDVYNEWFHIEDPENKRPIIYDPAPIKEFWNEKRT